MNWLTMTIGAAALLFGLYSLWGRHAHPKVFHKTEVMKERWGPRTGYAIHFVAYSLLPIAFGAVFVYLGYLDVSVF